MGYSLAFFKELVSCLLDASNGDLIVDLQALNRSVNAWGGSAREREHEAFWNVVKLSIRLESN